MPCLGGNTVGVFEVLVMARHLVEEPRPFCAGIWEPLGPVSRPITLVHMGSRSRLKALLLAGKDGLRAKIKHAIVIGSPDRL